MAYQVLARKYRPQRFSDVVGQDHVTRTLLNALAQNRIAHGYIFSGHRGIGKTTIARILASALNCRSVIGAELRPTPEPCGVCESCIEIRQGNAVDVIEIDAATNRGIDEIRELRDAARYRPSRDKYKIYILDEAHQITDAAFNALLKTLEEPPDHIVFMMATTQPEDIPQTIRSRCQHFSFHAVKLDDIVGQLRRIALAEHILADDATLSLLAEAGDGSMRDALSIMDQAIASAPSAPQPGERALGITQVRELMGSVSNVVYEQILEAVHANNSADILSIVGRLLDAGNGAPQLARQFVRYLRNAIVAKVTHLTPGVEATGIAADLLQISPEERNRAARSATLFTEEELSRFLSIMLRTFDDLGYRQEQRFHLELGLLKLVHMQRLVPIEELLTQLGAKPTASPSTKPSAAANSGHPASDVPASAAPAAMTVSPSRSIDTSSAPAAARVDGAAPAPATMDRSAADPDRSPVPSSVSASPFEPDRSRRSPATFSPPIPPATNTEGSLALAHQLDPAPTSGSIPPQQNARPHLVIAPSDVVPDTQAPQAIKPPPMQIPPGQTPPSQPPANQTLPVLAEAPGTAEMNSPDPASSPAAAAEVIAANPLGYDLATLQSSLVAALAGVKGQQSASEQIDEATFALDGDSLQIQTTVSKTLLPVVINAGAQRILQAVLDTWKATDPSLSEVKLKLLPGVPATSNSPRKARSVATGSAAELAEKHPIVQQAKRIFSAEISNVIDLRGQD